MKGKIQLTLVQIDNYGPWTMGLGPHREPDLQILQSELYSDLQRLFSSRGGLAFYGRFDNMLAISNGIDLEEHREILESISRRYPVTVSMGIGVGTTAYEAQENASYALRSFGASRSSNRTRVLASCNEKLSKDESMVQIAHLDVTDVSSTLTDTVSAYEAQITMLRVLEVLSEGFLKKKALVFFMGGDNFVAPSNGLVKRDYVDILEFVSHELAIKLKAGVGVAQDALGALNLASEALDALRHDDSKKPVYFLP